MGILWPSLNGMCHIIVMVRQNDIYAWGRLSPMSRLHYVHIRFNSLGPLGCIPTLVEGSIGRSLYG